MGHFFVIGGGELQVNFIQVVKSLGYITHVFDYDCNCPGKNEADYFHLLSIDDIEGIYKIALQYYPLAVQTVATEMGNVTACAIGERLGLRNNSLETALNTTDKSRMKKVCQVNNISTAKAIVLQKTDILHPPFSFPFVVKASDRSASRGITLVNTQQEFMAAYEEALNVSYNKIVLAEEYLPGQQYSVETISSDGMHHIVAVTEENTNGIPDFVETKHLMPARLNDVEYDKLKLFIFKVLEAFHVKYGAGHIELKYNSGKWSIIEIATRMGGWRDEMAKLSMGIDYLKLIVDSAIGNPLIIQPLFRKYAIVRVLVNTAEWKKYLHFKSLYSQCMYDDSVKCNGESFQATTLMETKGRYYLVAEDEKLANYFMED